MIYTNAADMRHVFVHPYVVSNNSKWQWNKENFEISKKLLSKPQQYFAYSRDSRKSWKPNTKQNDKVFLLSNNLFFYIVYKEWTDYFFLTAYVVFICVSYRGQGRVLRRMCLFITQAATDV